MSRMAAITRRASVCLALLIPGAVTAQEAAKPPYADTPDAVVATVGGQPISMRDLRARAGDDLDRLEVRYLQARYQLIRAALDSILYERVLTTEAQKRGTTVEGLLAAEGVSEPSSQDIEAWYTLNQARLGGRTFEQLRPQIANLLRQQRRAEAQTRVKARLFGERQVRITLEPVRLTLRNEGAPTTGPDNAPVTLVEFSDFQCPYCAAFSSTVREAENTFGDRIRVVYRQFPLTTMHPQALKAAEASLCANRQGKFRPMHDLMFREQERLTVADLKEKATRLGLDRPRFDACLDGGTQAAQVQRDRADGARVGVNGTPTVFVNGVLVVGGAVQYDVLAAAIREELERVAHK